MSVLRAGATPNERHAQLRIRADLLTTTAVCMLACGPTLVDTDNGAGTTLEEQTEVAACRLDALTIGPDGSHGCGVDDNDSLWCWGLNHEGQLGFESDGATFASVADRVGETSDWMQVAAGTKHTCGLKIDGSLWCWGSNASGELGSSEDEQARSEPAQVGAENDWLQLPSTLGESFSCAIRSGGSLWCWGRNSSGQLGTGITSDSERQPTRVGTDDVAWVDVALGKDHACAVRDDHSLWCWGDNHWFQLGVGSGGQPRSAPTQVGSDTDWSRIATGTFFTCGLRLEGSLWCWGSNQAGALGLGEDMAQLAPARVGTDNDWTHVSAGSLRACGLKADRSLWCWGNNLDGALGFGDSDDHPEPRRLGAETWSAVAPGHATCGLETDGSLWCWGWFFLGSDPAGVVKTPKSTMCKDAA